jgi:hypothetical protein
MVEPVHLHPCARHPCVFSNHRVEVSSVGHHAFDRYLCLSVTMQRTEMMYLLVTQLAKSLFSKDKQRGGTSGIDEAINLDREGTTYLFLWPFRAVK